MVVQTRDCRTNLFVLALGWLGDGLKKGSWVGNHACSCGLERSSSNPSLKNKSRILQVPDGGA